MHEQGHRAGYDHLCTGQRLGEERFGELFDYWVLLTCIYILLHCRGASKQLSYSGYYGSLWLFLREFHLGCPGLAPSKRMFDSSRLHFFLHFFFLCLASLALLAQHEIPFCPAHLLSLVGRDRTSAHVLRALLLPETTAGSCVARADPAGPVVFCGSIKDDHSVEFSPSGLRSVAARRVRSWCWVEASCVVGIRIRSWPSHCQGAREQHCPTLRHTSCRNATSSRLSSNSRHPAVAPSQRHSPLHSTLVIAMAFL